MWLVPLGDLTEDQIMAVQASTDRNRIIVGGPGSGKTLVLVHRAHQLILSGVRRDRVRVLVFTNVLKEYLREGLADLGLIGPQADPGTTPDTHPQLVQYRMADLGPRECAVVAVMVDEQDQVTGGFTRRRRRWYRRHDIDDLIAAGAVRSRAVNPQFARIALAAWDEQTPVDHADPEELDEDGLVQTFDAWVRGLYGDLIGGRLPVTKGFNLDHELIRAKVHAALQEERVKNPSTGPRFAVALVDEGQDLSPIALEILAMACGHVTLAMDSRQQIYDLPTDLTAACTALGVKRAAASLLTSYRCTPLIVDLAASFLPDPETARRFRQATLLPIDAVETPVAFEADSDEAELDELAQQLLARAMNGERSAVLVPSNRLLKAFADGLQARNLEIATDVDLDFDDLRPMLLTYHKAKGLTVDSVFLPRLIAKSFPTFIDDQVRPRLLFVGVTRATRWAWLGLRSGDRLPELVGLDQLITRGGLKLKTGSPAVSPIGNTPTVSTASAGAANSSENDLADLL